MPDALASASIAALRAGVVRNSIRAMRGSTALRRTPPLRRPGSWITAGASRAGAGSVIARAADFMTIRMQVHGARAATGGQRGQRPPGKQLGRTLVRTSYGLRERNASFSAIFAA